ncbi:VWA domain-containing protein [Cyanobium gracile UHCC 0139]|uniref:VWA domain-containing protein n=1 Tax=Cyanobium gracile UHCC 0139 TaxID=3110308 RepID=A0ABU5RT98_9CYAN|nr:VWA domain-containing protein [Cyanobium gracile]MEA5391012.1 VWA domain-containing protein [Cyanobium gracile UHCC 0139]
MPFPDVKLANRPLHFLYLCDCSGSMAASGKMQALNQAIRQSLPGMAAVARDNPEARVLVRAVSFADHAAWHIETPTPVDQLEWRDLQAGGITAMGAALQLVAAALQTPPMEVRALPPVLVLISDGQPTDDFAGGLEALRRVPWAQKAVRLAIALGHDADLEVLQRFIGTEPATAGRSPRRPLQAGNATSLAQYIQWASTAVVGAASMPASRVSETPLEAAAGNIPLPDLPPTVLDPTDDVGPVVW